ncbi:hypothetical protein GCM10009524_15480 [Spirilliplanes yamanashiensis]
MLPLGLGVHSRVLRPGRGENGIIDGHAYQIDVQIAEIHLSASPQRGLRLLQRASLQDEFFPLSAQFSVLGQEGDDHSGECHPGYGRVDCTERLSDLTPACPAGIITPAPDSGYERNSGDRDGHNEERRRAGPQKGMPGRRGRTGAGGGVAAHDPSPFNWA